MNQALAISRAKKSKDFYEAVASHPQEEWPKVASWIDIASLAMQQLRSCSHPEVRQLQCVAEAGKLIIRGEVSSYYLKQLAQETLRSLNGKHRIMNQLDVVYKTSSISIDHQS
ncbi:BON domain-containing protein [Pirellulaceae bacterium SH467]